MFLDESKKFHLSEDEKCLVEQAQELDITSLTEAEIDEALFILDEALNVTSRTKRTKEAKIKALVGSSAMVLAKQANDPLYKQLAIFNKKRLEAKAKIQKKYSPQAKQLAKKIIKQSVKTAVAAPDQNSSSG